MAPLEDELGVPSDATLIAIPVARLIPASNAAAAVRIAPETCTLRPHARCLLVGRQASTADVRISHGSISRKHALLYYTSTTTLVVQDLGSKYGTTVNAQRITGACPLRSGDSILFGNVHDTIFTVEQDRMENQGISVVDTETAVEATSDQHEPRRDVAVLEQAGAGLEGRAKRQAEIAAMMATLDEAPVYEMKVNTSDVDNTVDTEPSHQSPDRTMFHTAQEHGIPIANRQILESETERRNATTCLSIDPAGSRFVVGSTDTHLRCYDFGGMDRLQSRSFRTLIPEDGYWPVACCYSNTGDRIVVGTGSVQPTVLDREGETVVKFVRGDMYVTDQSKTSGHTAAVTGVDWHPLERDILLTSSLDGSARIWNLNGKTQFNMLVCDKVFQAKNQKGQRTAVTFVCFHPAGREFALGTTCGSVQIWSRTRLSARPERTVGSAHGDGRPISSLTYSLDGSKLASRSVQDTSVKVWNAPRLSRTSEPLVVCIEAGTIHDAANAAFSPDATILVASVAQSTTSGNNRVESGQLNFYNVTKNSPNSSPLLSLRFDDGFSPVMVKWHVKINQIFVGCSNGQTIIFFDPAMSKKGAIIATGKAGKRVDELSELLRSRVPTGSAAYAGEIITPLYKDIGTIKRKRDETEPVTREPERPATGKHKTGSQGAGGAVNLQQFVASQNLEGSEIAGKDPREALFKYTQGKSFVDRAYQGNAHKLAEKTAEQEEEDFKQKNQK